VKAQLGQVMSDFTSLTFGADPECTLLSLPLFHSQKKAFGFPNKIKKLGGKYVYCWS
jgi:hypothetical protein